MKTEKLIKRAKVFCEPFRVSDGADFRLKNIDPGDTLDLKAEDKPRAKDALASGVEALAELQDMLYAQDRWSVLLIFQALDAAGKDGAIKHVMSGVNPQGCQVFSFKAPSSEDLKHDFMWRCLKSLPERGRIGIFNRSYYEETLAVRVHPEFLEGQKLPPELITDDIWDQRFKDICKVERYLANNGVVILKFFLHVSKGEQKRRFLDRMNDPDKNWKFSPNDTKERGYWKDYMNAFEETIRNTATKYAPWYVVPADNKWFTRVVVAAAVITALSSLDLAYPKVGKKKLEELEAAKASVDGRRRRTGAQAWRRRRMTSTVTSPSSLSTRLSRIAPGLGLLRSYQRDWLRPDVIAGITLAAYLLPASIGDASLAGLPPQAGIYACMLSGLVYWLFCSARHTAITVTSAISLLVGASLSGLAGGDPSRFGALAATTALLVALIALVAWIVRAGAIVNFISETVLVGFKAGVALYLASTQLPKLFGFKGGEGSFWERSGHFLSHLGDTNMPALTVGLCALAVLVLGKVFLKNRPVGLVVVIGGIAVASLMSLDARGVKLLGEVPQGLPPISLPAVHWSDLNELLPLAIACFMLGAVETAAIGRMFTAKHGGRFDSNQEFLGLAASNLAAGLGQGFPVSGGMSQSLVNESGGARTPVSGLVAAVLILIVSVFLSGSLRNLPQPVLAAIVLVAVAGLFKLSELRHLWRADRAEFTIAIAALMGVLGSGLLRGVMIGAVISLIQLLRRGSQPHVAFLGRIPGTQRFSDLARNTDNEPVPGMVIFRVEASLLYFNFEYIRGVVLDRVRSEPTPPKLVLCDLSASPHVDLQSAQALRGLADELAASGIPLQLVEARASVRDRLRAEGLDEKLGGIDRFGTVAQAVDDFERQQAVGRAARST